MKFAIVSDLHCRLKSESQDSLLTVGDMRIPENRHPVQALISLIRVRQLKADVLLVPGDLTNRISLEGLSQGWDFVLEISRELRAKFTIPVLGNHDVDSRKTHDADSARFARFLRPGFPFTNDDACSRFFSDGFAILNIANDTQLVVINSVVDHQDEKTAKRGSFSYERLDKLAAYLGKKLKAQSRLAMMHHHPTLHTGPYLDSADVIPNGDALIDLLKNFRCKLVIHGHKHHPRLTYVNDTVVFAAGSFSANLGQFGGAVGNMFHLVDLRAPQGKLAGPRGTIESWTFQLMKGWTTASRKFSGFPHRAGFGALESLENMVNGVIGLAPDDDPRFEFPENAVLAVAPELQFITPLQYEEFARMLLDKGWKLPNYDEGSFDVGRLYPGTRDVTK
jgi:3',5'-cyclic AMP phosphodiesterase CpdA